jgi:hypothetical protein
VTAQTNAFDPVANTSEVTKGRLQTFLGYARRSVFVKVLLLSMLAELAIGLAVAPTLIEHTTLGIRSLVTDLMLATVAIACVALALNTLLTSNVASLMPMSNEADRLRGTVVRLRLRAIRLRRSALFCLALIIAALASGLTLFYLAAEISDPAAYKAFDTTVDRFNAEVSDVKFATDYLLSRKQEERRQKNVSIEPIAITDLAQQTASLTTAAKELRDTIAAMKQSDQTRRLISTISTRVGAVLILIFLVQILVVLYRYSIRLANYYDARADALEMSLGDAGQLMEARLVAVTDVIAPEKIAFDREPKTPIQHMMEAARIVASAKDHTKTAAADRGPENYR